jgi:hypothetical protein
MILHGKVNRPVKSNNNIFYLYIFDSGQPVMKRFFLFKGDTSQVFLHDNKFNGYCGGSIF